MRIALFEPEIAGNVGSILRTAACLGIPADIVEPCGFPFSDRALRRAGMDYVARGELRRHADWRAFVDSAPGRIVLLTTAGDTRLPDVAFEPGDVILAGGESAGVPPHVHAAAALRVRIPMRQGLRSLNVAAAVAIALAEALRQTGGWPE